MADELKWVLIGDPSQERFELLRGILDNDFLAAAERAGNFEDFRVKCKERHWNLLLVAHDLPKSPTVRVPFLRDNFAYLNFEYEILSKGCIVDAGEPVDLDGVDPRPASIHVPRGNPTLAELERIRAELGSLLPPAPRLPDLSLVDSPSLREQIRSLADGRSFDDGTTVLRRLLRDLFRCEKVEVAQLGQGASGAKVFRARPEGGDATGEFIIKLSYVDDLWKILLELERHAEAEPTLNVAGYVLHSARLVEAKLAHEHQGRRLMHVVNYKNWYAVGYDFLGGQRFGKLIDLEAVVVSSAADLEEKTRGTDFSTPASDPTAGMRRRIELFGAALDWLCRNWYMKEGRLTRAWRDVWKVEDGHNKQYPPMPPYQLAGRNKGHILSFLDSRASRIGERLFDDWAERRQRVWDFVEKSEGVTGVAFLDCQASFILSPAHGDLNGNNMMLWLDQSCHPFLIDFPFFQKEGHALQDFARLEVEVKLALMDRQSDSPVARLPALDYTSSQMPLWKEMEDHLLSDAWGSPKVTWAAEGFIDNVNFCLRLIQLLRSKAAEVQQQLPGSDVGSFMDEYRPALLYHTVKASGYGTLTVMKRLLSVYSASRLLAA